MIGCVIKMLSHRFKSVILKGELKLPLQNICLTLISYSSAQSVCEKHYKRPLESLVHKKDTLYTE